MLVAEGGLTSRNANESKDLHWRRTKRTRFLHKARASKSSNNAPLRDNARGNFRTGGTSEQVPRERNYASGKLDCERNEQLKSSKGGSGNNCARRLNVLISLMKSQSTNRIHLREVRCW